MAGRIPLQDVSRKYNTTKTIWNKEDYWHFHLYKRYRIILSTWQAIFKYGDILNIGSANEHYNLPNSDMVYLDAAETSLPSNCAAVCADAHQMPFRSSSFQSAIAIGSVLNYCAPAEFFYETARVLKLKGFFAFDFEQSEAFEHRGKGFFGKNSALFETEFNNLNETIWIVKKAHIEELLKAAGFDLIKTINVHSISSLIWHLTESNALTAAACWLDPVFCKLPIFKERSSSVFFIAQKTSSR